MYQYKGLEDTIAAISTPSGQGGIGVVRLSGKDAVSISEKMFKTKSGKRVSEFKSFTVHYGWVYQQNNGHQEIVDEALLTIMRGPKSYTKEDIIEISSHGGPISVRSILSHAISLGARLAQPGEFTKRAYLNGRIDLPQAEAVLDIIQSKTDTFLRVSTNQLKGELSTELEGIREELLNIYVEIEAIVNFPDDEIDAKAIRTIDKNIEHQKNRVDALLKSSQQGRVLKEGIKIVICGKPNVGKSSLLNNFLKQPRAIVSDIAGTTRDAIEETAQIQGVPFLFVDTAGILDPKDLIEEEAIKRSHLNIQSADLILFVLDGSRPIDQEDRKIIGITKGLNTLIVVNKSDLQKNINEKELAKDFPGVDIAFISATKKEGLKSLEGAIVKHIWHTDNDANCGVFISNLRHINSLSQCSSILENAGNIMKDGTSLEFVSEELKSAVNKLDDITGKNIDEDLMETIFSQFCIGK